LGKERGVPRKKDFPRLIPGKKGLGHIKLSEGIRKRGKYYLATAEPSFNRKKKNWGGEK